MDRHEQVRVVASGESHPVGQRDETVVGPCHIDSVETALLQLVAEDIGEGEGDLLLVDAACGARAVVDAAMTGVEHHDRASD